MGDLRTCNLRWYQFSLRSLLLFFLFCSIPLGWLSVRMQRAREQKDAVEAIKKLGGGVTYDYELEAAAILKPGAARPPGPRWLRRLLGDDFFASVSLVGLTDTQATDADLEQLKGFSQFRSLILIRTKVTDAGLEHLKGLGRLQWLLLGGTKVTDAGLERLKGWGQLRVTR